MDSMLQPEVNASMILSATYPKGKIQSCKNMDFVLRLVINVSVISLGKLRYV